MLGPNTWNYREKIPKGSKQLDSMCHTKLTGVVLSARLPLSGQRFQGALAHSCLDDYIKKLDMETLH